MLARPLLSKEVFSRDTELRHVSGVVQSELHQLLDENNDWREIMARVRRETLTNAARPYKYTAHDIKTIERAGLQQRRSCTEIFFSEWGTSGRRRPTLTSLLQLLIDAQLFRAADYVAALLGEDPPARPAETPAALVDVSISSLLAENARRQEENNIPCENNVAAEPFQEIQQNIPLPEPIVNPESGVLSYPYRYLEMWTNNFNSDEVVNTPTGSVKRRLGTGGFGSVFLAQLPNGTYVAVKKLHIEGEIPILPAQFNNEVKILSVIHHSNLLSLVGYSNDGPACCLLYEYLDGGNLQVRLANQEDPLPWRDRIRIAECVSKGLAHLHSIHQLHNLFTRPIVHRDVKTANILLSSNGDVKLGDFGLIRWGPDSDATRGVMTSNIVGSTPYMAVEAFRGDISIKMDTFSYGVVLVELMTSLPAYDPDREDVDLVTYFESHCKESFGAMLDGKAGDWPSQVVERMFQITRDCLRDKPDRPVMALVRSQISELVQLIS